MKLLSTLFLLLCVSFASAQDNQSLDSKDQKTKTTNTTVAVEKAVVISVKGIKTMEEIDIENYNKALYLDLIASKKQKPKRC